MTPRSATCQSLVRLVLSPIALGLLSCAAAPAANVPSASTTLPTASASAATAPPATELCTAVQVRRAPARSWAPAGSIKALSEGKNIVSAELRDAAGKLVETTKPDAGEGVQDFLARMTCRLGAVLFMPSPDKPVAGQSDWVVVRAISPSEKEDLQTLCSVPEVPLNMDASEQRRVALQSFEEGLTTKKWREWARRLKVNAQDTSESRQQRAQELSTASKAVGLSDCWFATRLKTD